MWNFGDAASGASNTSTLTNPSHIFSSPGTYTVSLTLKERCQTSVKTQTITVYGVPTYGGASQPLVRQAVEGSGFAVALRVNDGGTTAPYSLKGFQLEYQLGARR